MITDVNITDHVPTADDTKRHGFRVPDTDFGLAESPTMFPVAESSLWALDGEENLQSASDTHKAIVRSDTRQIVGIVSKSYRPLANSDYFVSVEDALREAIPEEMREGVLVRDRVAGVGGWTQREYVFPAFAETLRNTSYETKYGLRIVAWNSYDGSASAGLMSGLIDFMCTNGVITGRDIAKEMRRHTTRLEAAHFLPRLRQNMAEIGEHIDEVRKMAETPLRMDDALGFLDKHLSGQRAAEMLMRTQKEAEMRGETLQALHAALTNYASHNSVDFQTRSDDPAKEARLLRGREDEVYRMVSSPDWRALVAA